MSKSFTTTDKEERLRKIGILERLLDLVTSKRASALYQDFRPRVPEPIIAPSGPPRRVTKPFNPSRLLATRVHKIQDSPTLSISAKAKAMKKSGIDVVDFGVGEPDFDTPPHIKEAAKAALDQGFTHYTPVPGIPELRKATADWIERNTGVSYQPEEVMLGVGGKGCLANAALVLFEEGDQVLLPAPYWVTYPPQIALAGAETVVLETTMANAFKITPDQLAAAVTQNTKALILNSPSNPTGSVYSAEELEALAKVIVEKDLFVISDDVYDSLVFDNVPIRNIASLGPDMRCRTLMINALSKSYAMTGWRIGVAAGPKPIIDAMIRLQGQTVSHVTSFCQKAAVAALEGDDQYTKMMLQAFQERRNFVVKRLNQIPGVSCTTPGGAFYAFPDFRPVCVKSLNGKPLGDCMALATYLLEEYHVSVVPGAAFGAEGFLRLSFATDMESLRKGLDRIEAAVEQLED